MMENQSGVYEIVNIANGKRYVGQAADFAVRWKKHRLDLEHGRHHSPYLQRSWATRGSAGFEFRVLEYCSLADLTAAEQRYMDALRPEYNSNPVAGSRRGAKLTPEQCARRAELSKRLWAEQYEKMRQAVAGTSWKNKAGHTAESKAKISAAKRGVPRPAGAGAKTGAALRGRPRPQDVRDKIAAKQRGVPRAKASEETRAKLRVAQTARRERERVAA